MAGIGNAWRIPKNPQPPGQASMRFPLDAIEAGTRVTLSNGNPLQGTGTTGNQTQSGSELMVKAGDATWTPLPLHFHSADGKNKYFTATIPANTFRAGDVVQYYFKIGYTDLQTTFVHGSDGKSLAALNEWVAQNEPFTFAVRFPLAMSGPFLSF